MKRGRPRRRTKGRAVALSNRLRAQLARVTRIYVQQWYPVVDEPPVVLNVPFRRRKRLLAWFPAGTVRAVRGIEFATDAFRSYIRWDPESSAVTPIDPAPRDLPLERAQMAPLRGSELLRLAREAARAGARKRRNSEEKWPANNPRFRKSCSTNGASGPGRPAPAVD